MHKREPDIAARPGPQDLFVGALLFAGTTLAVALLVAATGGAIPAFYAYLVPVAGIAFLGGLPAGIAATMISAVTADYLFLEPRFSISVNTSTIALGVFALAGVAASVAGGRVRRIAAERSRLAESDRVARRDVERHAAERWLLAELASHVAAGEPIDEIASWAAEHAARLVEGWCGVLAVDGEPPALRVQAVFCDDAVRLPRISEALEQAAAVRAGAVARALSTGEPQVLSRQADLAAELGEGADLGPVVIAPMRAGDAGLGVVVAGSGRPSPDGRDAPLLREVADRLAVALHAARLERAGAEAQAIAERARAEAEYLVALAADLGSAASEQQVFDAAARRSVGVLGDLVVVWRATPAGALEPVAAHHRDPLRARQVRDLLGRPGGREGEAIAAQAMRDRHLVLVEGERADRGRAAAPRLQGAGRRAAVAVPLGADGAAVGAIAGVFTDSEPGAAASLRRQAQVAADQVALALRRLRLEESERARASRIEIARGVLAAGREGAAVEDLCRRLFALAESHAAIDAAGVWRAAEDDAAPDAVATSGQTGEVLGPDAASLVELGARAARERRRLMVAAAPDAHDRARGRPHPRAALALPLITGDRCLGAVALASREADGLSERDLSWLSPIADHLALALDAAALRGEAEAARAAADAARADAVADRVTEEAARAAEREARAAEQAARAEFQARWATIEALQKTAGAVCSAAGPEPALQSALEHAMAITGANAGAIALATEDGTALRAAVAQGSLAGTVSRVIPLADAGVFGEAYRTGRIAWAGSVAGDTPAALGATRAARAVAVPLICHGRTVGALGLGFALPHALGSDVVAFLSALADHAAIAAEFDRISRAQRDVEAQVRRTAALDAAIAAAASRLGAATTVAGVGTAAAAALHEQAGGAVAVYGVADGDADLIGAAGWPEAALERIRRIPVPPPAGAAGGAVVPAGEPAPLQEIAHALGLGRRGVFLLESGGRAVGLLVCAAADESGAADRLEIAARFGAAVADALARARAADDARHAADEAAGWRRDLDALRAVIDPALSPLDAPGLVDAILERVAAAVRADGVGVFAASDGDLVLRVGRGPALSPGLRVAAGTGSLARAMAAGGPLVVDLRADGPEWEQALRARGATSLAAAPLVWRRERIGVAVALAGPARQFGDGDLVALQAAAERVAAVVAHERLVDAERRAREAAERAGARAARVLELTAALPQATTPAHVAAALLEHAVPAVGARAAAVALPSSRGAGLEVVRAIGFPEEALDGWARIPVIAPVPLAEAFRTGEVVAIESGEAVAARYPLLAGSGGAGPSGALVAAPLVAGGSSLGAIELRFDGARALGDADRAFLLAAGRQCAQALERIRLSQADARRAEALGAAARVSAVIHAGGDAAVIAEAVADAARRGSGAAHAVAFWSAAGHDGSPSHRWTGAGEGLNGFSGFPAHTIAALFGQAAGRPAALRLDDARRHQIGDALPAGYPAAASYLAVPVLSRAGDRVGGLILTHPEPARFTAEAEEFALSMARQMALALADTAEDRASASTAQRAQPWRVPRAPDQDGRYAPAPFEARRD